MAIIKGGGYRPPSSGGSSSTPSNPNSVYIETGFTDLADLQSKNPTNEKKLYLTDDNKLYRYVDGVGYEELTSGGGGTPSPHTHVIGDVEGLQVELDGIQDDLDKKIEDTDLDSLRTDLSNINTALDTHTHSITDVDGLQTELDNKAKSTDLNTLRSDFDGHIHLIAEVVDLQTTLDGKASATDLATLRNEFDTHTHTIEKVNGLQTALDSKANSVDLDTLRGEFDGHTHEIADVNGLQLAIDARAKLEDLEILASEFLTHKHTMVDDIDGLQGELDSKATVDDLDVLRDIVDTHEHEIADVHNLQVELDLKATAVDVGILRTDFENHTHEIADVNGLQTSLDGLQTGVNDLQTGLDSKASAIDLATLRTDFDIHTHVITEVDGLQTALDNKVEKTVFDSHTHEVTSVNGLQEALDLKANTTDIPTNVSQLTNDAQYSTESFVVAKIAEAQLDGGDVDLSAYATKDELTTKADTVHTHEITDINGLRDELDTLLSTGGDSGSVNGVTLYKSLEDLSITEGEETIGTILEAMEMYSVLTYRTAVGINADIYPSDIGTVKFEKFGWDTFRATYISSVSANEIGVWVAFGNWDYTNWVMTQWYKVYNELEGIDLDDVTGLQTELSGKASTTDLSTLRSDFDTHVHEIEDVNGLQAKLDTLVTSVNGQTGDVVVESGNEIIQSDTLPEGIEEGRLWIDTSEEGDIVGEINDRIADVENAFADHLLKSEYRPFTGSLKDINYTTKIYAHGTATDRPASNKSFFVDVKVRGDNTNYRVLVARAHAETTVYTLRMVNGVWDSAWHEEGQGTQIVTALANSQTIPTNANTDLVFNSVSGASWASLNGGKVKLKAGKYDLVMTSIFTHNVTGFRAITGHINTANVPATTMTQTATRVQICSIFALTADTELDLLAYQSSGGALSLSTTVHITKVGD